MEIEAKDADCNTQPTTQPTIQSEAKRAGNYIRVSSPAAWIVVAAVLALLTGIVVWTFTAMLPATVRSDLVMTNGVIYCFLPEGSGSNVEVGMEVVAEGVGSGRVTKVWKYPYNETEVAQLLNSKYLADVIMPQEWAIPATVEMDASMIDEGVIYQANIVTSVVRPIELLLD